MPDILDVDDLMKAAAVAARRNDAVEAAALLRRVVALQEQSLGPSDRELAPTLNNLGLMLERQGDTREAERCYRRAYNIARRGVGANDPLAQVARSNLVAFLQATGKLDPLRDDIDALDLEPDDSPSPPVPAPPPAPPASKESGRRVPSPAQPHQAPLLPPLAPRTPAPPEQQAGLNDFAPGDDRPLQRHPIQQPVVPPAVAVTRGGGTTGRWLVAALALTLAVAAWFIMGRGAEAPSIATSETPTQAPAAPQSAPAADPPRAADPTPSAPPPRKAPPPSAAAIAPSPRATPEPAGRVGADTSVCAALARSAGAWRCTPLGENGSPDAVYFYTRVKSPRDMVVRHRWTYQGQTVQSVALQVRANTREGFRTFSIQRIAGRPGRWEVALVADDGSVVGTQGFTIAK